MMKKILNIVFTFLTVVIIFFTTVGFIVTKHHCNKSNVTSYLIGYGQENNFDCCNEVKNISCCNKEKTSCKNDLAKSKCCTNNHKYIQIEDDYIPSIVSSFDIKKDFSSLDFHQLENFANDTYYTKLQSISCKSPPGNFGKEKAPVTCCFRL